MEKHLAVLKEKHLIDEWHDEKILPGSKWNDEIEAQMKSADIILLLLSSDFLASPSCKEETNRAFDLSAKKGIGVAGRKCSIRPERIWNPLPFVALRSAATLGPRGLSNFGKFPFHSLDRICIFFAFMMFSRFMKRYFLCLL